MSAFDHENGEPLFADQSSDLPFELGTKPVSVRQSDVAPCISSVYPSLLAEIKNFPSAKTHRPSCGAGQLKTAREEAPLQLLCLRDTQTFEFDLDGHDRVYIQLVLSGTFERTLGDLVNQINSSQIHITNFPRDTSIRSSGSKVRGVIIGCDRHYLLEHFQLDLGQLPETYRSIFTARAGFPKALVLPVGTSNIVAAEQLLSCKLNEPLRTIYLSAKMMEVVCDVVARINGFAAKPLGNLPRRSRLSHAIETAAAIYKREIHKPPTIEQLGRRVGLNRNELTTGFKDVYGVTPHVFSRQLRMNYGLELLANKDLSISEVARRIGYGGYASFTRAYQEHFGRPLKASPK